MTHAPGMGKRRTAHWKFLLLVVTVLALSAVIARWMRGWLPFGEQRIFHRVASVVGLVGLYVMRRRIDRRSIASLGWAPRQGAWTDFLTGVRLGAITLLGLMAVLWWCGAWHVRVNPNAQQLWWSLVTFVPSAMLIGGVEELVFRGYVLRTLMEEYTTRTALLLTSGGYALAHLFVKPPTLWPLMWADMIGLFGFGIVLAYATLRTQLLYLPIGLHASLVYLVKSQKHLIAFDGGSPAWLFGSERLVTGAFGWLALGVLGWWVWRVTRDRVIRGG